MKATSLILAFILSTSLAKAQNAPQASYFPLQNVKLLDSPFLQAQQTDLHYILALNPDRLLAPFLREAGLTPKAPSYTNWENTGRIAFSRDGYTFVFGSYCLPKGKWTDICISGDYKGTSLYVNGKLQERLEGRKMKVYCKKNKRMDYMPYQETLIFPLRWIGNPLNGFKGKIQNVTCVQK